MLTCQSSERPSDSRRSHGALLRCMLCFIWGTPRWYRRGSARRNRSPKIQGGACDSTAFFFVCFVFLRFRDKEKDEGRSSTETRMCINAPRLAEQRGNLAAAMKERLLSAGTAFDPPFRTFFHFFPPLPFEIYRRPHYLNYCLMINRAACAGYVHKGAAFLQKKQFSLVRTIKVSSDLFMQQCK